MAPEQSQQAPQKVQNYDDALRRERPDVAKNFHEVLIKAMDCLMKLNEEIKHQNQGRYSAQSSVYRERAKALVTFDLCRYA
jgi:hypothetical protein